MSAETYMTTPALSPLVLGLGFINFVQICIENLSAIEFHFDKRAVHCYLLAIPHTNGLKMSALGCS